MRRLPKDLLDYAQQTIAGRASPKFPKRGRIENGPTVTSTPAAMWWLFSRHTEDGQPQDSFRISRGLFGKMYWDPWTRPSSGLDIDRCIEELIKASKPYGPLSRQPARSRREDKSHPHYNVRFILPEEKLERIGHLNGSFDVYECPYQYVRQRLAEAVGLAYDDEEIDKAQRTELPRRLKGISAWLGQATDRLDYSINEITRIGPYINLEKYIRKTRVLSSHYSDAEEYRAKLDLLKALDLINSVKSKVEMKRESTTQDGRPEQAWWVSFTMSCGLMWTTLTGVPPELGHAGFERFLKAANESLGGKREEAFPIKTALVYLKGGKNRKPMHAWDQLDAEIEGIRAPEHRGFQHYSEEETRYQASQLAMSVLSVINELKGGNETASSSLKWIYTLSDNRGKMAVLDLLGRHDLLETLQSVHSPDC